MENAAVRPLRVWPLATLAALYWIFTLVVMLAEMPVFVRFMSGALSALAFLILFIILWSSNGTLAGRTRLVGVGLLFGGAAVGAALAHPTYGSFGFLMASVPYVLTGAAFWLAAARRWPAANSKAALAAVFLVAFGFFDLVRWEGLDGRLHSSISWRWSTTPEQAFLASKGAAASEARPLQPWTVKPGDSPEYRGLQRDGVVRGLKIANAAPPTLAWKQPVGPAWSGVIVVDGRIVTQEQRGDVEATVCYDA